MCCAGIMGRKEPMLGAICSCAALVLELLVLALRAAVHLVLLKVRVCLRAGPEPLQAVGAVGAATAVRLREHSRVNGARQGHVRCACARRARRAVLSLVHDRVRVSLVGFA